MKRVGKSNRLEKAITEVFKTFSHDQEGAFDVPKSDVVVGRKQRRREAKLLKKNKGATKMKTEPKHQEIKRNDKTSRSHHNKQKRKTESSTEEVRKKCLRLENKHEDKVIGTLEKKLFLNKSKKKKKLPKAFVDSGLDYLLDVVDGNCTLDSDEEGEFFKSAETEIPNPKITEAAEIDCEESQEECDDASDDFFQDDTDAASDDTLNDELLDNSFEEEEIETDDKLQTGNSNPLISTEKYIPPAKRVKLSDEQEKNMEKLRRKLKGLFNRLSEANMKSICDDIENLYITNSRAILHKCFADVLMNQFCTPDPSPESMIIENAMLISTLSIRVGVEILMHIYEIVALKLQFLIKNKDDKDGKASNNLIQLLSFFYQFKVIDGKVILDIFRILIDSFTEKDIELVLEILNKVGFQMRKEDPESLKNMIKDIAAKCNDMEIRVDDGSRMSYMLSVLTAIKNNNIRKVTSYNPDNVIQRRKRLAWLTKNKDNNKTETMPPIALQDFLDIEKNGRWWIVGSSFSGRPMLKDGKSEDQNESTAVAGAEFSVSQKIIDAAKAQRMNTDVRRKIFYAIMGADDYIDAFEKITKCCLKGKQFREIANVAVDCCQKGKTYNPYYMHLLNRFCQSDRQFSISIQCTLWDRFKVISAMKITHQQNIATLMSQLISRDAISLNCLKTVEFTEIDKNMIHFLRIFLCKLAEEVNDVNHLHQIFENLRSPKAKLVRQGLNLFLQYFLLKDENFLAEHSRLQSAFQTMAASLGRGASSFL